LVCAFILGAAPVQPALLPEIETQTARIFAGLSNSFRSETGAAVVWAWHGK
jgi:hypothetical protein